MKESTVVTLAALVICAWPVAVSADSGKAAAPDVKLIRIDDDSTAKFLISGKEATLGKGEARGEWTLVELLRSKTTASPSYAILEDYSHLNGRIVFVTQNGIQLDLPRSSEPTFADPSTLYLGHSREEIANSPPTCSHAKSWPSPAIRKCVVPGILACPVD